MTSYEKRLKDLLNMFWLRPENALMLVFKGKTIGELGMKSPSLEISCGDGMFTFMNLGGVFDSNFDYFQSTNAKNFRHDSFVDIYNACAENYEVKPAKRPKTTVDYGTDWKQGLLDKAAKLGLYKNLILHGGIDKDFKERNYDYIILKYLKIIIMY